MSTTLHSALLVAVIAIITAALRFAPFIVFHGKTPKIITYLADVLPYAIIAMLVVYCLRNISFVSYPYGLPELISAATVAILHIAFKKTLLSIGCGVVLYMVLIQLVFV